MLPSAVVALFWMHRLRRQREAGEKISRGEVPESVGGQEAWVLLLVVPSLWGGQPSEFLKLFLAILAVFGLGALVSAAAVFTWEKEWSRMEHRLFLPARLTPPVRRWFGHLVPVLPLLLLVPGFLTGVTFTSDMPPPWHVVASESPGGSMYSDATFESEKERGLPGASLYAAHLAYQEGFSYGLGFGLPPAEGVRLPSYRRTGGKFREEQNLVVDFSGDWLRKAAAAPGVTSLGALLFSPDAPYDLLPGNETAPNAGFSALTSLLYFLLLFYQIFHQKLGLPGHRFGLNETYLRRQAA